MKKKKKKKKKAKTQLTYRHLTLSPPLKACLLVFCCQVMLLVYHWSSSGEEDQHDVLISKPVSRWSPEEVLSWLDNMGPWAQLYRPPIQQEKVNGRYWQMAAGF